MPAQSPPSLPQRQLPALLIAIALVVTLIFFMLLVTAAQLTSPTTAERILMRLVAVVSEVDTALPASRAAMHQQAQQAPANVIAVPDIPVRVFVTPDEVSNLSDDELKQLILARAAKRLYQMGSEAFAESDQGIRPQRFDRFSAPAAVANSLRLLQEGVHAWFQRGAWLLGALAGLLAGGLILRLRSLRALVLLGVLDLAAAVPLLVAVAGLRLALGAFADQEEDLVLARLFHLGEEVAMIPVREYALVSVLGLAAVAVGLLATALASRWRASEDAHLLPGGNP